MARVFECADTRSRVSYRGAIKRQDERRKAYDSGAIGSGGRPVVGIPETPESIDRFVRAELAKHKARKA